ncbi:MAG: holo-ACP synthase [Myxococcales bacterium]|jgi:holo-[acyl-carrier protein] synthase|nr:holo-ACP synthase [Myxococcales bacterium]MBL0197986.1 holo-ACP synthase [Myxococcales bacterium]HQY60760.1 holo-ACP synthase [Polyangiaceae bacterium]
MIVGLGVDVCSIARMRAALERHGDRLFARLCGPDERADLEGRERAPAIAGRFAAKEAFVKATDGARGLAWHDCRVRRAPSGRPVLELHGTALALATALGADRWHVSLSQDAGVAVAVVVLEASR